MAQSHSFVPEPWSTTDEPELDWLYNTGSVAQALAYSELFWPRFTEHVEKYESWMRTLEGKKSQAEATLNHRHIADLFEDGKSAPHDLLIALGRILKQSWASKLRLDFPHRRFEVQFDDIPATDPTD